MTIIVHGFDGLKARTGQHLGYSDWLEVTQDRINMFADATNGSRGQRVTVRAVQPRPSHAGPGGKPS